MKTKLVNNIGMRCCKAHIIALFNTGILNMVSADWYASRGYAVVCEGGKVIYITEDDLA